MTIKRKICIVRAGDVTYISRIHRTALALFECGAYTVSIISIKARKEIALKEYPYTVHRLPIKSRSLKSNIFIIVRIAEGLIRTYHRAKKQKADIYMPISVEDLIIAFLITKFSKAKLVYNANELEGGRKLFKNKLLQNIVNKLIKGVERFILKKADCVIAADIERARMMEKWYDLEKVEVIRNVPIYQSNVHTDLIRNKLGLEKDIKILLYQGALDAGRGLEVSIIASSKVNDQQLVMVLLGDIEIMYKNTLLKLADIHGFKRLFFISAVPWEELLFWTSSADISLVLIENISFSYYLAAPNKLYESIMAEVPYIASDFPEINHVHNIARSGILVNPANINQIAKAIERLLSEQVFYEKCIENSRKAKEIFNWDKEKLKLIFLINNL